MADASTISPEVVEYVADLMARRWRKHRIKQHLEEELGVPVRIDTYEAIRKAARELLEQDTDKKRDAHRRDAIAFYESVIRDESASHKERIMAQHRLDKLMGLESQFTGHSAEEQADAARELLRLMHDDGRYTTPEEMDASEAP